MNVHCIGYSIFGIDYHNNCEFDSFEDAVLGLIADGRINQFDSLYVRVATYYKGKYHPLVKWYPLTEYCSKHPKVYDLIFKHTSIVDWAKEGF
jgi:hypothetical protein